MTSRATATDLQNFLDYLVASELAVFANPAVDSSGTVSWPSARGGGGLLVHREHPTVSDYRRWIRSGMYSAILFDFSLLQLTYTFDQGRDLVHHRLQYVPCPYRLGASTQFGGLDLDDLLELYDGCNDEDILLRTAIRFDFDRVNSGTNHPASHLTLNVTHCRVPCFGPLRLGNFAEFVFAHFYPEMWETHAFLQAMPRGPWVGPTITEGERRGLHLAWPA